MKEKISYLLDFTQLNIVHNTLAGPCYVMTTSLATMQFFHSEIGDKIQFKREFYTPVDMLWKFIKLIEGFFKNVLLFSYEMTFSSKIPYQ